MSEDELSEASEEEAAQEEAQEDTEDLDERLGEAKRGSPQVVAATEDEGGPRCAADAELLLRLVSSLQAEKAALDARLQKVARDGERRLQETEAENSRLRRSNLEKDRQLAALMKGMCLDSLDLASDGGSGRRSTSPRAPSHSAPQSAPELRHLETTCESEVDEVF